LLPRGEQHGGDADGEEHEDSDRPRIEHPVEDA
jgi:hypothetical protein